MLALPDGRLALAMGDVVGRGVPAASLMGQLRNALRAYALEGRRPSEMLELLNRLLHDLGGAHQMATLVTMVLEPETGELRYASAGHPPPLIHEPGGAAYYLDAAVGVPLGAVVGAEYADAVHQMLPGATVVLYTDGLVEDRELPLDVGLERLRAGVLTAPENLEGLCNHLITTLLLPKPAQDDTALLAVRWLALDNELHLRLPTQPRVLRPLRATLRRWLNLAGATEQETYEVLVAACEACSNAIKHGAAAEQFFDFDASFDGEISIVVRNGGRWRKRRAAAPGGRGIDIMKQFMDTTDIVGGDDVTEVRMRRRLIDADQERATVDVS